MRRLTLVAALVLAAVLITVVPVVAVPLAALEAPLTGEKDQIRLSGAPRGK